MILAIVGKSSFGLYLLYRALQDKRTVVYQCLKHQNAWVFLTNGTVEPITKGEVNWNVYLREKDTVFITDSIVPPYVTAFTIFITLLEREYWWQHSKENVCHRLFFPVFSK